jgi:hypothetical protein
MMCIAHTYHAGICGALGSALLQTQPASVTSTPARSAAAAASGDSGASVMMRSIAEASQTRRLQGRGADVDHHRLAVTDLARRGPRAPHRKLDRDVAAQRIADNYLRFVDVFRAALG